ncbi:hypothetical protein [Streptomyces sp. NPDC047108]|uniref:hypothetical protein n=1 Tax=Streptomyces sp. NPDC047108 TaxID=3155025 RepID=UPI0033FE7A01
MPERRRRAAFLTLLPASSCDVRRGDFGPAALPGAALALRVPLNGVPLAAAGTTVFPVHTAQDDAGAPVLRRERKSSSAPPPEDEDNPFAAPPENRPEQPWRPRGRRGGSEGSDGSGGSGPSDGSGDSGNGGDGNGDEGRRQAPWGNRWSSRQPGRQSGGFGGGPGDRRQGGGQGGPGGPAGLRWDPTDPLQRRARYALLAGMWGFFFALFSIPEIALLLGTLALYWGISALRGRAPRTRGSESPGPGVGASANDVGAGTEKAPAGRPEAAGPAAGGPPQSSRPQTTAAISGLVTGGLALAIVAATFTFQLVYQDYYACVDDALTTSSRQSCEDLLPKQLRPLLGAQD